jgi:RHS repeat-associated protein
LTKTASTFDGAEDYTYDATNQLTGATHTSQSEEAFQYDANGNRTDGGYQTGTNNQLLTDGKFNYQYDGEGNRTKRTEIATGKVTEYVWDYHNRLTSLLFKDAAGNVAKTIGYTYDVNNQRIGKNVDGAVERYILDRNQIALVFDGSGVQKSRYLYGTGVDQVLAEETGTNVRWFLADEQGTIKDVLDNTGAVIDHVSYDSLGRIVNQTNVLDLRYAYTGREWDGETGQYYNRARYYDPTVGRFISEDPLGFGAGDTNIYRYVGNSFVNETDPSGLASCDCNHGGEPSLLNRGFGLLKALGGAAQITTGLGIAGGGTAGSGGIAAAPSILVGGAIAAKGADDVQAGLRQAFTGRETNTVTHDVVANVTGNCALATVVDIGTSLAGTAAEIKIAREAAALARARQAEAALAAAKAEAATAEATANAAKRVNCFVAGTLIQTLDGEKAIQDIQIGDWVLSDDPTTPGDIEYKQVVQTFAHDTNYLVDVYIGGEKITTTENHPFWVKDVGWVAARDLNAGSQLETKTASWLGVDKVEKHTEVATVYNFEVQGFHTYFVSDLGLLVHNTGCGLSPQANNVLEKLENIKKDPLGAINSRTNHNHYDAARREAAGEVVAYKPDGVTPYDHIQDLKQAYNSLQNIRKSLVYEMNNLPPNITERGINVLLEKHAEVQDLSSRLKGFLNSL